jgi:hypothetical protein
MKKKLSGLVGLMLAALIGMHVTGVSAQQVSQLWSVAVHIEYADGFIYDHVFASGVPTSQLPTILQECGRGHLGGSAVQYHCYPIPE